MLKLREELGRRHKLIIARMKPATRGTDIGKMFALLAQSEKVKNEVSLLENNFRALLAEEEWLHATEGLKETQRQLRGSVVKIASGEFILESQLEEDKAFYADDGKSSFDTLLQSMKDEDASAARAPEDTTKQVSDGEDTVSKIMQLQSQTVSLFGSKLQVA